MIRRLWAAASLLLLAVSLGFAVTGAVNNLPRGVSVLLCMVAAVTFAWWGLLHAGLVRGAALTIAVVLVGLAVGLVLFEGRPFGDALVFGAFALALAAARAAFRPHAALAEAPRPQRPVMFYNPKSGGGKAERLALADEARARGVEPIELRRGDDLDKLVEDAIATGADALAMAGGDGSQAIVAAHAARNGLPYACIPSGTRNHFALDLGVDRDDVVGALDAFVDGRERRVDLAEVNGRVFVNNVSLGVYAEAVQQQGYRDAKLRTIAQTVPQALDRSGERTDLMWTGADGHEQRAAAVILISNDPYRLGRALWSGTRPRLDRGVLGVAVLGSANGHRVQRGRLRVWSSETFEVRSSGPVPAGVDGESAVLQPPLRFRSRPAALRVRIARHHPGSSPSAAMPGTPWGSMLALARLALAGPDRD